MPNAGFIGLGSRGEALLKMILDIPDVNVLAVCDEYSDRREKGAKLVFEKKNHTPLVTDDYREVLKQSEIDCVIIATAWEPHIKIAIEAMKAGKYVGTEVGGAYSIADCNELVYTSEETNIPCMLMENCCYGSRELMVLNMVRKGVFGEIVHCEGGYHHDLRYEIAFGNENRHYRLRNYTLRNCENYPTHELGPIAKLLDINRGNRMLSLTSVSSKSVGLNEYIKEKKPDDVSLINTHFNQGDITTTTIKCALGQTITLTLDTTLPRAYSRGFCVRGTKGLYNEDNDSVFVEGETLEEFNWKKFWGNAAEYEKRYEHPIWTEYKKSGIIGGHDGIDWLVFNAFFESVKNKTQTPIDVYDTAALMAISTLSEDSIALGGAPVAIPDFTRGMWMRERKKINSKYCLDK